MTILVTGGAGFIGCNFVRYLLQSHKDVKKIIIFDKLTYAGNLASLEDVLKDTRVEFIKGDITQQTDVAPVFERKELTHIVHFAAESHVDRSILGPGDFVQTNLVGTFVLLENLRAEHAKNHTLRFLHVSTDEVFGALSISDKPAMESTRYNPSSPYAASKAGADHLAHAWQHTYNLPILITNCSNNFGPWQFPEKLIPLMICNALDGKDLPVYGDGQQIRDWLHVQDHCEALWIVLTKGKIGETYNIGGENEVANLEVVQMICTAVDKKRGQTGVTAKQIRHVQDRPGHDRRYAIDISKIRTELNWKPKRRLQDSISELVDWYSKQQTWVQSIRSGEYKKFYEKQYGKSL